MFTWKIHDRMTGEMVFESDDPQAVVDEAHRLEQEAIDRGPHESLIGVAAGTYYIEGDPFELGVAQEHDAFGRLIRGPEVMRRPTGT